MTEEIIETIRTVIEEMRNQGFAERKTTRIHVGEEVYRELREFVKATANAPASEAELSVDGYPTTHDGSLQPWRALVVDSDALQALHTSGTPHSTCQVAYGGGVREVSFGTVDVPDTSLVLDVQCSYCGEDVGGDVYIEGTRKDEAYCDIDCYNEALRT